MNTIATKLISTQRHEAIPSEKDIFGKFVGKWQLDLTIADPDGTFRKYQGEWHFSRILQGRAIQDLWIIPAPDTGTKGNDEFHEYGTSIRTFDLKSKKWKVVWFGSVQNQLFVFDVHDLGTEIVLEECSQTRLKMKWTFFDIGENSFQWKSEVYLPDTGHWFTNYHMKQKRC